MTKDVLIPEQDSEILAEQAISLARKDLTNMEKDLEKNSPAPYRILDLCTGSGCLVLSILSFLEKDHRVESDRSLEREPGLESNRSLESGHSLEGRHNIEAVGTDISFPALQVAQQNALRLHWQPQPAAHFAQAAGWQEQDKNATDKAQRRRACYFQNNRHDMGLCFLQGDLFEALCHSACAGEGGENRFSMIVSNPPYIASDVIPHLAPEVRDGEPTLALDGGADGLDFYRRIAKEAPSYLAEGGRLLLEIGYDQAAPVTRLLAENGFANMQVLRDYGGNDRVVSAVFHTSLSAAAL